MKIFQRVPSYRKTSSGNGTISSFCSVVVFLLTCTTAQMSPAQNWVERQSGPAPGDSGSRIDAIVQRQILNITESSAREPDGTTVQYNHPSMLCMTRKGTMIFMWNGGPSEAEGGNRIFFSRKEKGGQTWSEPERLEDQQIDFGTIYQPTRQGAPVIAGYWLGPPPRSSTRLMFSRDDGRTWSEPAEFPATDDPFWAGPPADGRYRFSMNPPIEMPDGTLWWQSERFRDRSLGKAVPAIVVVPPDNYTGCTDGAGEWSSIHPPVFEQGRGYLGDFFILSPDYRKVLYTTRGGGSYLTEDRGATWLRVANGPHAGGGAGLAALSLDVEGGPARGWHLMAGTPHPGRNGMRVHISRDPADPDSWRKVLTLHEDIPAEDADPSMIQTPDRLIHLLFTGRGESKLKYYILDPDALTANRPAAGPPDNWPEQVQTVKAARTSRGVELTWEAADKSESYIVYRRRFEEGEITQTLAQVDGDKTKYIDTRAMKAGRHGYWVQAVNRYARGRWSKAATVYSDGKD